MEVDIGRGTMSGAVRITQRAKQKIDTHPPDSPESSSTLSPGTYRHLGSGSDSGGPSIERVQFAGHAVTPWPFGGWVRGRNLHRAHSQH
jgi:hypothetical protein